MYSAARAFYRSGRVVVSSLLRLISLSLSRLFSFKVVSVCVCVLLGFLYRDALTLRSLSCKAPLLRRRREEIRSAVKNFGREKMGRR